MSDNREIIYTVKLDITATNAALKEYAANIGAIQKSQADLNATTKDLQEASQREATARKKTVEAVQAEAGSIKALREENKKLTAERNNTTLSTEEGRKKVEALNKQLDENNAKIKENVDAYTKQKIGIGDYSAALDKLVPGLGATTTGIWNSVKASLAFIATPLGAVIGAIGLALGSLISYFKGSEEGQNRWNKIIAIGSVALERLKDVAEFVGEAIYNAFTEPQKALNDLTSLIKDHLSKTLEGFGDILQGIFTLDWDKAKEGVQKLKEEYQSGMKVAQDFWQGIKDSYNEALEDGAKLSALQAKIDKDERAMIVERARVNLEVAKLRERAVSEEGDVKRATIMEAIELEKKLSDLEVAAAKTKLEQAKLELQANGDDKEALLKVAQATAAVINADAQRFEATLRFQKEIERLDDAEAARKEKIRLESLAEDQRILDAGYAAYEKQLADKAKADAKAAKDKEAADKIAAEKQLQVEKIKSGGISGLIDQLTAKRINAQSLYTSIFKKGALAETYANTKAAAIAAYKALAGIPIVGPVLGIGAALAATAYGLVQATGIQAIAFAKGGRALSGTKINASMGLPINRSNGDNLLATVRTGEVILNERQQAALGGASTFKKIGVPGFASGGISGISSDFEIRNAYNVSQGEINKEIIYGLFDKMPRQILVLQDFEAAQYAKQQVEKTAIIQ